MDVDVVRQAEVNRQVVQPAHRDDKHSHRNASLSKGSLTVVTALPVASSQARARAWLVQLPWRVEWPAPGRLRT